MCKACGGGSSLPRTPSWTDGVLSSDCSGCLVSFVLRLGKCDVFILFITVTVMSCKSPDAVSPRVQLQSGAVGPCMQLQSGAMGPHVQVQWLHVCRCGQVQWVHVCAGTVRCSGSTCVGVMGPPVQVQSGVVSPRVQI